MRSGAVALALVVAIGVAYADVGRLGFVRYDDTQYVTENPVVRAGLTREGVSWAFQTFAAANWHPLTWLSHMLDVELFGVAAGPAHRISLALHGVNSLLLFWLLRSWTGALWRPALVAGLFALHPMHVESVAWISERKDVLSTLFWLLTTAAWTGFVKRGSLWAYAAALTLLTLGLLAKPMLVTLPFTLLLLDLWPFARLGRLPLRRLILEKLPLWAVVAASIALTLVAQRGGGAVQALDAFSLSLRLQTAVVALVGYVAKLGWPVDLAVFYPHPRAWSAGVVAASLIALAAATAAAIIARKSRPWLTVGWLWFLGTLVPVLGVVQVGMQWMADRYSYVPSIGLAIVAAFGMGELASRWPRTRRGVVSVAIAMLVACGWATHSQVAVWHDTRSLFEHALAATGDNFVAQSALGSEALREGRADEALRRWQEAARLAPDYVIAQRNLALVLSSLGRVSEATRHLERYAALRPRRAEARFSLAQAYQTQGRYALALREWSAGLEIDPGDADARAQLATVLARLGRTREALTQAEWARRQALEQGDARAASDAQRLIRKLSQMPTR